MRGTDNTRRSFLRSASLGLGAGAAAVRSGDAWSAQTAPVPRENRLPREVWIATITQEGLTAGNHNEMIDLVFQRMAAFETYRPDIVCLPETFPFTSLSPRPPLAEIAETPPGPITSRFADYARSHGCYVICPTYTKHDGRYYNAAVLIDRNGAVTGEYHKIRPTGGEVESGITPGPLDPPVFKTDFGTIGIQICFDIEWEDGWRRLARSGAEIIFWPSAFAGGRKVNAHAHATRCCVVSSTNKDTAKICDITGEEVERTGRWNRWTCAPVNLEKAFLHTWPFVRRFDEIRAKYGRKVRIVNFHEEEWSIIESLSPDVRVADILTEFELRTIDDHLHDAEIVQNPARER